MSDDNTHIQQLRQQVRTLVEALREHKLVNSALHEQVHLRDVLLLINTTNNPYDRSIVESLLSGTALDNGEWAHVFDEAAKLKNLPEIHARTLANIYERLNHRSAKNEVA